MPVWRAACEIYVVLELGLILLELRGAQKQPCRRNVVSKNVPTTYVGGEQARAETHPKHSVQTVAESQVLHPMYRFSAIYNTEWGTARILHNYEHINVHIYV